MYLSRVYFWTAPLNQVLSFYSTAPVWVEEQWEDGQRDRKRVTICVVSTGNNKIINYWKCKNLTHDRFPIMLVLRKSVHFTGTAHKSQACPGLETIYWNPREHAASSSTGCVITDILAGTADPEHSHPAQTKAGLCTYRVFSPVRPLNILPCTDSSWFSVKISSCTPAAPSNAPSRISLILLLLRFLEGHNQSQEENQ